MMPGVGFAEMILLVLVGIVVIGPKDLPLMMRKFGRFTGKMRAMAFEFKQGFDELGRQAELDELRKEVADLKKHTGLEDLSKELEEDRINVEKDVASAMSPLEESQLLSDTANGRFEEAPPAADDAAADVQASDQTQGEAAAAAPASSTHVPDAGDDFHIDGPAPEPKSAKQNVA